MDNTDYTKRKNVMKCLIFESSKSLNHIVNFLFPLKANLYPLLQVVLLVHTIAFFYLDLSCLLNSFLVNSTSC